MTAQSIRDVATVVRPTAVGGLLVVFASIVTSLVAYSILAESIRIHWRWTVGTYHHYGPEYAPTLAVLTVFPMILLGLYISFRWGRTRLEHSSDFEEFEGASVLYEITTLALLGIVISVQIALVAANMLL